MRKALEKMQKFIKNSSIIANFLKITLFLSLSVFLISCSTIECRITSDPQGADIYAGSSQNNLRYQGVTPRLETYNGIDPYWAAWYYQFKKSGYEDEIIFKSEGAVNESRYVHAILKPQAETSISINIVSNPPGAAIYEGPTPDNLTFSGITPFNGTVTGEGPYWKARYYKFEKPGYLPELIHEPQGLPNQNRYIYATLKANTKSGTAEVQHPGKISQGTAWPIGYGYVVTCAHILGELRKATLILHDETRIQAKVELTDKANDIAILKVQESKNLPKPLVIAKTRAVTGTKVFTIGYPYLALGEKPKLTEGIINSVYGLGDDPRIYQISAPVQPGNSGGPLINMKGEVVGIVTSRLDAAKIYELSGTLPQIVNYAIKSQYIEMLIETLPVKKDFHFSPPIGGTLEELVSQLLDSVMIIVSEQLLNNNS